ncbi:MAG TPA: STT3 domain-containing protein, partial [Candidatus Nanoarchaeia archaeon]|nr:STT3 domain-containing protein [Candidatus Nanoarchaeia archaeon]
LSPMFLSRTLGSDTDIWNIIFPLIAVWVFLEAFETKSLRSKIILSAIFGVVMGVFSFAWGGWWYIFDFVFATLIIYLAFTLLRNYITHKNIRKIVSQEAKFTAIILAVLFISSAVFVSLILSPSAFLNAFTEPSQRFATAKLAARENYWPNILTTVAEMNEAGIDTIISQTAFGINLFFVISLLGIVFTLVRKKPVLKEYLIIAASALIFIFLVSKAAFSYSPYTYLAILMLPIVVLLLFLLTEKESAVDIKPAILLTVWFVGMILAGTKGVRFILLVIPAFCIAFGIAIGYLHQYLARMLKDELRISESITKPAIFILLCFLLVTPIRAGINTGESFTPSMTSGWWETLGKIREESQPDAIINSWWDFGHWFKYVADRRVTVDGAGQHYQLAHWMGTVLVNNDEEKAIHTLRMLDCGSFQSYETLYAETNDVLFSVDLLKEVILQDKEDARKTLEKAGISKETIDKTLGYAFCKPPENYLITSEDMVGKAGVWAHFGLWDFEKAYMIREVKPAAPEEGIGILREKFNYSEDEATNLYYELQALESDRAMNDWISPWPNYLIGDWLACSLEKVGQDKEESNLTNATANEQGDAGSMICPVGSEINRNEQARTVIDGAIVDLGNYQNSTLVISSYDLTSGYKIGTGKTIPSAFVLFKEDGIERVEMENSTFPYDVLVDLVENRSMICDPHLSESLFTKLFYLDGRYTTQFEKFSELTDMTGARISVWKVKWDPQFLD